KLNAELSEHEYNQSKFELLPNLNAGFEHRFNFGRSLDKSTYSWEDKRSQDGNLGISSNLMLFNGLKNLNTIQKRHLDLLGTLAQVEKAKNDMILTLATSYLQILFDEELLEIAKNQLEVTSLQVDRMSKMVEVGNRAKGDLLDISAQMATEKLSVTNAENQLKISILTLTQLLDLDSVGDFKIVKIKDLEVENIPILKVESIYDVAIANLPQIKNAEYFVQSSEKALAIAKADRYPNLELRSYYYSRYNKAATNPLDPDPYNPTMDYPYSDQIKDNQYRSATLNLSIPIFNRRAIETNINRAKISMNDSRYRLDQTKQLLYKEIQQAHADAKAALDKYYSATEAVISNEEAFNYTEQKFNVGLVSSIEFNEAKNNLTRAKSQLLQAKYEYIFKTKILDFYMGIPITL
ncbi:MAG: TolC family protein, partial [Bacteroidales bacterium]|nr:TolC family protein [Bacteroidales bacterium]